jgi:pimeloyl-ACP methyl ester carboxylesterase
MTPLFFGSSDRRLFGIYSPGSSASRAVVLCNPWGQEYIRAHRSLRRLAVTLADAGYHVLRFDYFGTGDSSGDTADATLEGWRDDIAAAVDELRDMSGATSATVIGLRLGATLAAEVAGSRLAEISRLVLWDPVVSGTEWRGEVRAMDAQELPPPGELGECEELLGFELTPAMRQDIEAIDLLPRLRAPSVPTDIVTSAALPGYAALRALVSPQLRLTHVEALRPWHLDKESGAGAIPIQVIDTIVRGLAGSHDP